MGIALALILLGVGAGGLWWLTGQTQQAEIDIEDYLPILLLIGGVLFIFYIMMKGRK